MAEFITELLGKRRNRISASSDDSASSPNNKKSRQTVSTDEEIAEEDTILTALEMTANFSEKVEEILERLKSSMSVVIIGCLDWPTLTYFFPSFS